jgi:hypothetical protein
VVFRGVGGAGAARVQARAAPEVVERAEPAAVMVEPAVVMASPA